MSDDNKPQDQQQDVQKTEQMFRDAGIAQTKEYVDNQIYIQNLANGYYKLIEAKYPNDEKRAEREKSKFSTFCRGIVAEVESRPPDESGRPPVVSRSGKYTYKAVMDLAFNELYGDGKDDTTGDDTTDSDEPTDKKVVKKPDPEVVPSPRRSAGDIKSTGDDEFEDYEEIFPNTQEGVDRYVKFRKEFTKDTKTLKGVKSNQDLLEERLAKFKESQRANR